MSASGSDTTETRSVTLSFAAPQILHEIADLAYTEGELIAETAPRRLTQDIIEGNNMRHALRNIEIAFGRVRKKLYPLTATDDDGAVRSDIPKPPAEGYIVRLNADETIDGTRLDHLENLIHQYVVFFTLFRWLEITYPDAAEKWGVKIAEMDDELSDLRFAGGVMTRPLYPF